ncbi:hypothetical protein [Mameliella sp.]|uniref:hypothetical protein n=1 Tax=Mameliella sp. TaxID=1924940 RepID=UPI003BA9B62B
MSALRLLTFFLLLPALCWLAPVWASAGDGPLDGRVFAGRIGPADAPDLGDRLYFDEGHFWSGICTDCGFHPGPYTARQTEEGIVFGGVLRSNNRGRFDYQGIVRSDGAIEVAIRWSRQRWYWTARRDLAFTGKREAGTTPSGLTAIRTRLTRLDPTGNPRCARF